jgi:hypothetical protein
VPTKGLHQKTRARLAVETILAAIKDRLRAPLEALLEAHVQAVEDEYVLMEGDGPDDGDTSDSVLEWWRGLYEAQNIGLSGEVAGVLGVEAVDKWVRRGGEVAELVDALLNAPVKDTARALAVVGITEEDIASLVVGTTSPAAPAAAAAAEKAETPAAPKEPRKRALKIDGPNLVTTAAQAALVALCESVTDAQIADALGVSRPQAINYRKGVTLLAPSADQLGALTALFDTAIDRLATAFGALRTAIKVQELE